MQPLTIAEVMRSPVITITPETPLPAINAIMCQRCIRHLPVLDHDRLVGIVTLGDVRNALPCDAEQCHSMRWASHSLA